MGRYKAPTRTSTHQVKVPVTIDFTLSVDTTEFEYATEMARRLVEHLGREAKRWAEDHGPTAGVEVEA